MGVATLLIGLLPTYATIGIAAPILLTLLRIAQGIGVGGEWGGSVLLSMEWGSRKRRGLMASWPQLGVPLGLLLSTGAVKLTTGITGAELRHLGLAHPVPVQRRAGRHRPVRAAARPGEPRVHRRAQGGEGRQAAAPRGDHARSRVRSSTSAFVRLSEQAPFYIFITFVLTYGTEKLKFEKGDLLNDMLVAAAIGLVCVPLFGFLSDIIGRRTMYGIGIVCIGTVRVPLLRAAQHEGDGLVLLAIVLSLVFHDMQYGPQAALISESFGTNVRYSGAGLGYQLASVIAGGPAPLIAAAILESTGLEHRHQLVHHRVLRRGHGRAAADAPPGRGRSVGDRPAGDRGPGSWPRQLAEVTAAAPASPIGSAGSPGDLHDHRGMGWASTTSRARATRSAIAGWVGGSVQASTTGRSGASVRGT